MKLIVGLGNPGSRYAATRHNIGFRVVEAFAAKFRIAFDGHEKDAFTGNGRVAGGAVMVAKPQTYMNLSGESVAKLARAHVESLSDLIVVYDDVDLPVGKLRLREKGSAGTHNGMRSIVTELGSENFARLRFGVRGATISDVDLADYVLDAFTADEERTVADVLPRALDALVLFARGDLRRAMNTFNRDPETEEAKSE